MTPEKLQSIAFKWIECFNGKELEKLLALYDEDAEHYSPKLKIKNPNSEGRIEGKPALRTWWQEAFEHYPNLHYKLTSLTANGDRVFMEYLRIANYEPELKIAEVLVIKDNKIIASRVYHG